MQKGYAFISYSTKNQAAADSIRELLKRKGIATWMAPGDIPAGSKYAQVINRAVKECSCFVLVLTEDAQNSVWVAKEVERAINYRRPIIPVQLEDVTLNDEFELYISSDQLVAIRKIDEDSEEVQRLLAGITSYTGVADPPSPACSGESEPTLEPAAVPQISPCPEVRQELGKPNGNQEVIAREAAQKSPPKPVHTSKPKAKKANPVQYCYFGAKKAQKLFSKLPDIIELPSNTDIVLTNSFAPVVPEGGAVVSELIVPEGVQELQSQAFAQLGIRRRLALPATLKQIGEDAFILGPDAYVDCELGSAAYAYCKERGIRTSADMELWRQYGRCQYCGGNFSFLKNCKLCGKHKDY